ncbi:hypothetical protein [Saccharopolyspora sp. NPDC049357]
MSDELIGVDRDESGAHLGHALLTREQLSRGQGQQQRAVES